MIVLDPGHQSLTRLEAERAANRRGNHQSPLGADSDLGVYFVICHVDTPSATLDVHVAHSRSDDHTSQSPAFHICTQAQVFNLFKDLPRRYGFSLMLVTHDLPVVTFMYDDMLVITSGAIVERGGTRIEAVPCRAARDATTASSSSPPALTRP